MTHEQMRVDDLAMDQHMASKMSMEEEDGPLDILQTKEQRELANYDEENRAIHEISRAREQEFRARKPLVHQESDLMSEESNRDIDWDECDRMRNKILGAPPKPARFERHADEANASRAARYERRRRHDSNFSAEETQSSGSSGDRRRTGVIEDIDDDEFFLRQRGVSQDNADISEYISSAIRDGHNRPYSGYSDEYFDKSNEDFTGEYHYARAPAKADRGRSNAFNRSYEYEPHHHRHESDDELPVATQYFQDNENTSYYYNGYYYNANDELRYASDDENADDRLEAAKPIVPKRRHRSTMERDSVEYNGHSQEVFGVVVMCARQKKNECLTLNWANRIAGINA